MTDLPVIGVIIQLFQFLIDQLPFISDAAVAASIPIALAALAGVVSERSGVVNIGLEGMMLTAAFVAWITGVVAVGMLGPSQPTAVFGITLPLLIALGVAMLSGMVMAGLHAWLSISLRADQIISGVIINIAAIGLTGYLYTIISKNSPTGAGGFDSLDVPAAISGIPVIGWLINAIFDQGPIAIGAIILIIIVQVLLFRTRWGLRTRSVGEHPRAAETMGIDVIRLRYRNVILSGAIAALGGAYLSIELTTSFQAGMTAGRGFIGLAAMIVGRWSPLGAFGAALLFASSGAVGRAITFAAPENQLGDLLNSIPPQFYDALPYIVTIVVLAGIVGRSIPPAADGQPYERESAT
ncbi:MAG TPA: ABC transporter permease [Candidatus Limnocylindrales bacterium]|nr:ABC transporter permease [Candidatus Limnocylindrales bacterium]